MIIYMVTNLVNSKVYVGKTTKTIANRKRSHLTDAKKKSYKSIFHKAIIKHGIENFEWGVVDRCMFEESLNELEKYYIKKFKSKMPYGYNMTDGGEGACGTCPSDETRGKMSEANSGKSHWNYGGTVSEETRKKQIESHTGYRASNETKEKMKAAALGHIVTEETKNKISNSRIGKYSGENSWWYGKHRIISDETKIKMSESAKKR